MENVSFLIGVLVAVFMIYFIMKNANSDQLIKIARKVNDQNETILKELARRERIIGKVQTFLKESCYVKPIGRWKDEVVYKYIVNKDVIYEFEDFLTEKNHKIGIDDNELCFKQISYRKTRKTIEEITLSTTKC